MSEYTKKGLQTKHVLIIINELRTGGAQKVVVNDIKNLSLLGYDVTLLTLLPEISQNTVVQELEGIDVTKKLIEFKGLYKIKSWINTIRFIKDTKPDVLITHLWYSNAIGRIAGQIAGVKNIVSFEHNVYDSVKQWRHYFVDRILQYYSKHIVAVSNAVKESLLRNGIQGKRVTTLLNSVDVSQFERSTPIPRGELNLSKDDFVYIFVGRLIPQKAVDILIKAFAKDVPGKLLIVGDGPLRKDLEMLAKQFNVDKRVFFLGLRHDVPELLKTANCFVLSSRYEGVGIVVLEALASGLPVIISDFSAGHELIKNEESGLIVPIDDPYSLSLAMKKIYLDKELRDVFVKNSKLSIKQLSQEKRIERLLKLL